MADTYDIEIDAGATFQLQALWKDSDGDPINLTGYSARMHIRRTVEADDIDVELTSGSGITLGGTAGTIDIEINDATTSGLSGEYVYDLELESGGGVVSRVIQGAVTVIPEVTRE